MSGFPTYQNIAGLTSRSFIWWRPFRSKMKARIIIKCYWILV